MDMPEIIYCSGNNRQFASRAIEVGMQYGARLPATVYFPLAFADQDWKRPDRRRYMTALAEHKPQMATVLDWERHEQLSEVLGWSEEAAQYVRVVVIVPKVHDGIRRLPRVIAGAEIRLGFSVPSHYGGTEVMLQEFAGWPVHLLGGTPRQQMLLAYYLDVKSADGNGFQKAATKWCKVWSNSGWHTIEQLDGVKWGQDAPYEAFRRSCVNIMAAWRRLCS